VCVCMREWHAMQY